MKVTVVTDPVISLGASLRPALYVAEELRRNGFQTLLVTSYVSPTLRATLKKYFNEVIFYDIPLLYSGSLAVFEAWVRSFIYRFSIDNRKTLVLNFSSTLKIKPNVYYGQGPISSALEDMYDELPGKYRYPYKIFSRIIRKLDLEFIRYIDENTDIFIANSNYTAKLYQSLGIKVNNVLYPPLNTNLFKPETHKPRSNYVLTYFGKETKFKVIKEIADLGVKIKAFGEKVPYIPKEIIKHENIEYLGKVSNKTLVLLYTNALYTLFPFTHEPFGYVPVESMACGTPVLTYNKQGPSETVIHNVTGWLARNDDELIDFAVKIWNNGYSETIRKKCRKHSLKYDARKVLKLWKNIIVKMANA